ncbi:MAG: surface lipoprotein assembly modifier [Wenzhouxiangella sp.]|jgi:hypothetical protein|nr:surface lipoprotein assembly modifier [Wenzhouxiangella sp.]
MTTTLRNRLKIEPLAMAILSASALAYPIISAAQDNDQGWPVEVTLAAGLHYDDLVTVEEIDRIRDVGDAAVVLDLDIDYEKNFEQGTDLRLGYSLSQKSYFEESDFDLQIHNFSFGLKQNFEDFDLGLETYHVRARLDNSELLSFTHLSPYFTRFLTRRLYLRGAYIYRDKQFPDNPGRDGDVHGADADFYYFIDGTRHYFVAGFRYEDEDTRDPAFDFHGKQFDLRYSRRFDLYGDRPVRLRLDWRYEERDYSSLTPSIGAIRDDLRQRWRVRVDLPIRDRLTALLSYQYRDHESNLPSADFTDNRFEAQLEFEFD